MTFTMLEKRVVGAFPRFLFYLVLLSAVCCLSWAPDGSFHFAKVRLVSGVCSAVCMATLLTWLAGMGKWAGRIVTGVLLLLAFTEVFVFFAVRTRITERVVALVAQTNGAEASEFLGRYFFCPAALWGGLFCVLVWLGYVWCRRKWPYWGGRLCRAVPAKVLLGSAVTLNVMSATCVVGGLSVSGLFDMIAFPTVEQLAFAVYCYNETRPDFNSLECAISEADGTIVAGGEPPYRIVWVIGESFNKHHASIYGYRLPTTPCMSREVQAGNMLVFNDAVSPSASTGIVMSRVFSPYSDGDSIGWERQPLVPVIFRNAGYTVTLHDNQTTAVKGDNRWDVSNMAFFNRRAVSDASFDYRNDVLKEFDLDFCWEELPRMHHGQRNLTVFHLMGQHMDASRRYPAEFGRFSAGDYAWRPGIGNPQKEILAHYDNATFYNDSVLGAIMEAVAHEDAIVIYHSDHGEEVFDFRDRYGRMLDDGVTPQLAACLFEIPMVVYTTPLFRERHPDLYGRLSSAVNRPVYLSDIAHLLMDIGSVESRFYKPGRSPISRERPGVPVRRIVNGDIDYDSLMRQGRRL